MPRPGSQQPKVQVYPPEWWPRLENRRPVTTLYRIMRTDLDDLNFVDHPGGAVVADCAGVADGPSSWAQYGAGGVGFDDGAGGVHGADGVGGADGPLSFIQGGAGVGDMYRPREWMGSGTLNLITGVPWWCHEAYDFANATVGADVSQPNETALSQAIGAAEWIETLQHEYVEEADGADGAGDAT